jgi:dihydroorotate dehydrogenase electron transfer subunit
LHTNIDKIRIVSIEEVIDETPTVRTLVFNDTLCANAKPGQFTMVWMPRIDELPMSIMISEKDDHAALTIRKHGPTSTALYNTQIESLIGVRGPYGNSFNPKKGRVLLVGGGTGLVPLMRLSRLLAKKKSNVTFIMGSKSKEEVIFERFAKKVLRQTRSKVIVATEDGTYGVKGFATDAAEKVIDRNDFDIIYTCGPERMMKKVLELAKSNGIPAQASLERLMKCGIGICCSCCVGRYLVCKDGPVMDGEEVLKLHEFGLHARDKSGRISDMW